MKFWIIKVRRFQDNVCPLIFVPLLCCLQWYMKPLLGQIIDETAATNNIIIKIYWTNRNKREYTSELILYGLQYKIFLRGGVVYFKGLNVPWNKASHAVPISWCLFRPFSVNPPKTWVETCQVFCSSSLQPISMFIWDVDCLENKRCCP